MYNRRYGFSLVELLVVITIVAVLTAVAVPAYNRYREKAAFSSVNPVFDDLLNRMVTYAGQHGRFPNAAQLGLPTSSFAWVVVNPENLNPLIDTMEILDSNTQFSNNCPGRLGSISGTFNTDGTSIDYAGYFCYLYNISGTIKKNCAVYAGSNGGSMVESIIPGWTSMYSNSNYGSNEFGAQYEETFDQTTCM